MARFAVEYVKPSSATVPGALVHATERSADAGVTSEPQRGREATCGQAQHAAFWSLRGGHPASRGRVLQRHCSGTVPSILTVGSMRKFGCAHARRHVSDHLRTKLCQRAASETCGRGVCDRSACRVRTFPHAEVHVAGGRGSAAYAERLRSVVMYKKLPRGHLVITR